MMAGHAWLEDECKTNNDLQWRVHGLAMVLMVSQHYARPHVFNVLCSKLAAEVECMNVTPGGSLPSSDTTSGDSSELEPGDDNWMHTTSN